MDKGVVDREFGSVSMLSCLPITTTRFNSSSSNHLERILHRRHVVDYAGCAAPSIVLSVGR